KAGIIYSVVGNGAWKGGHLERSRYNTEVKRHKAKGRSEVLPVMATVNYTAKDITVLEGLEPVRKRPGMYIGGVGSPGLHHLVWEILDNAIDEAMNGYAANITLILHKDASSITVIDDGRSEEHTSELQSRG